MKAVEISTDRYTIDAGLSKFTVQAFASGLLSAFGHNPILAIRDVTGEIDCQLDALQSASLRLVIRAASLAVQDDIKAKDRREMEQALHEDVLETAKFPEIVFQSSSVAPSRIAEGQYRVNISGSLTLHGVTQDQTVIARVLFNGGVMRATGDFSVQQTKYGIKLVSAAGGALKVKDDLQFQFDIVAKRLSQ